MVKTAMQIVQENRKKLNPNYAMYLGDIDNIYQNSDGDVCKMIINAFIFGYVKGQRAERSRRAKMA